ncbi:Alanine racemase [Bienertia sinuspersici]
MTQKANLFKGQQKKKAIPPNRHGKDSHTRKGKRVIKPLKITNDMDKDREVSKFINYCNEVKAATVACKDGGQLSIVKTSKEPGSQKKNHKD